MWISEVMLQQTRVAVVVPYFERFLRRFPDVASLAGASEDDVLALWSGLGYYGRARSLLTAARLVVERHGGRIPSDPAALRSLPGVGRYTAGAIASVAFGRAEPVLDGNVRRVLARLLAARTATGAAADRALWSAAEVLVRGPHPGDLNQALMELGALVCTPRTPGCRACPLAQGCRGFASGSPERYPRARPRPAPERVRVAVALAERRGRVLLERPSDGSPLRGTWDLPAVVLSGKADPRRALESALSRRHGLRARVGAQKASAPHAILDRRLALEVFDCRVASGAGLGGPSVQWVSFEQMDETPTSGATRKVIRICSVRDE